jgi:hypothetical protein
LVERQNVLVSLVPLHSHGVSPHPGRWRRRRILRVKRALGRGPVSKPGAAFAVVPSSFVPRSLSVGESR